MDKTDLIYFEIQSIYLGKNKWWRQDLVKWVLKQILILKSPENAKMKLKIEKRKGNKLIKGNVKWIMNFSVPNK